MFGVHFGALFQVRIKIKVNGLCSNIQDFGTQLLICQIVQNQKHKAIFVWSSLQSTISRKRKKKSIGFILLSLIMQNMKCIERILEYVYQRDLLWVVKDAKMKHKEEN